MVRPTLHSLNGNVIVQPIHSNNYSNSNAPSIDKDWENWLILYGSSDAVIKMLWA